MADVTIEIRPNGPYVISGAVELRDTNGGSVAKFAFRPDAQVTWAKLRAVVHFFLASTRGSQIQALCEPTI